MPALAPLCVLGVSDAVQSVAMQAADRADAVHLLLQARMLVAGAVNQQMMLQGPPPQPPPCVSCC
jgi:hypothetical protein